MPLEFIRTGEVSEQYLDVARKRNSSINITPRPSDKPVTDFERDFEIADLKTTINHLNRERNYGDAEHLRQLLIKEYGEDVDTRIVGRDQKFEIGNPNIGKRA